ncbi:MAG: CoA pyrophosphatase [Pseudomonadota bacterium]
MSAVHISDPARHDEADRLRRAVVRADAFADDALDRDIFFDLNPDAKDRALPFDRLIDAAVLVPVVERPEGLSVVFTVRSSQMPSHAGQISFPGGKISPSDDSHAAAAVRETEEEIGVPARNVEVIGRMRRHLGGKGYLVTPYVGLLPRDVAFTPDPREVADIFEAPLSFILNPDNHTVDVRKFGGVGYNFHAVPYGDHHIWGLTAGIIHTLAMHVQEEA